jgi:hypothetical protein
MRRGTAGPRRTAGIAAALLVILGCIVGITIDRTLLSRAPAASAISPLTLDAMVRELDLDTLAQERVRQRLESLEATVTRAAEQGTDSLLAAARMARRELEEVLPHDRRGQFRHWMEQHRSQMMERMRGGMMRGMGGRGMMGPASLDSAGSDSGSGGQPRRRR